MELLIRDLQQSDIGRLARIEEDSFSMPWSPEDFADLLKYPYCTCLVALSEDVPIACAVFRNLAGEGNIDNVVVARDFRGRGVAQRLLGELLLRGEEEGIRAFTLEVRAGNAAAIHVYEKLGFVSEGIRPGFYERPAEDAVIMWRRRGGQPDITTPAR